MLNRDPLFPYTLELRFVYLLVLEIQTFFMFLDLERDFLLCTDFLLGPGTSSSIEIIGSRGLASFADNETFESTLATSEEIMV